MRLMLSAVLVVSCAGFGLSRPAAAEEVRWERFKIDPVFRSEGIAAADINHDGKIDIINGEAWYEAPNWTMHPIRKLSDYGDGAGGYSHSFADWAYDLNGDGWTDLICIDFPGIPCYWFENPKNQEGDWKKHEIWHSAANETPQFLDVTGDGKPELIMASETEGMVGYLEIPAGDKVYEKWTFTAVSPEKLAIGAHRYYHGLGVGDVNKDGRLDIVIPHGWWEGPEKEKLGQGLWTFHPHFLTVDGKEGHLAAADLYVDDLDLDGDNDIIMSSAHARGVWWFENVGTSAEPKFQYRVLSDALSQTHALHYVDINGDGEKDLVTGKRWWAHGPGGDDYPSVEPLVVWFELHRRKGAPPQVIPHMILESLGSGIGTQFMVTDFDGDKLPDIVLSNKKGTNLLLQRRTAK
jgi:FG-GAP-like repeat